MTHASIPSKLVWLDLEMTGLDPQTNVIIEIATIITDSELNELAVGPVIAIAQPQSELDKMDAWNVSQHTGSGLVARVEASKVDTREAERQTLAFVQNHVPANTSPLCGNSVCTDRQFLVRHMPQLHQFFHYRLLDVSSIKIATGMWCAHRVEPFVKRESHLALDDIRDSIQELRHYRKYMCIP